MPSSPADDTVTDLVMPKLGLTMTEGVLAEWRVGPGDRVRAGDVVFVVETDKIANEVEAPGDGEIVEIVVGSGETVPVGAPLARWTGAGQTVDATQDTPTRNGGTPAPAATPSPAPPPPPTASVSGGRILATPLARRLARESGIALAGLTGSGPNGRIKAADVEAARAGAASAPAASSGASPAPASVPSGATRVAASSKHLAMVRRVVAAKRDVPHFYLTRRAEVSALLALRGDVNAAGGPKATLNHFVLKAVGRALVEMPEANRIWDGDAFLALPATDVGMVVDTPDGLFIPVLRDVGRMPFDRLCREAGEIAGRARTGGLAAGELEGGAVSVSNLGMAGVETVAPIVNPPQAAILGVGAVDELFRPDADGAPVLRRELALTLACDHRVLDGMGAARFLDSVVRGLEAPHGLFLTESRE